MQSMAAVDIINAAKSDAEVSDSVRYKRIGVQNFVHYFSHKLISEKYEVHSGR